MRPRPLLLLLTTAALPAQDVPAPERFAAARTAIAADVAGGATSALSLAVLDEGAVVWAEGFGLADRERQRPATADTIYRLASISKPFTATAVMQLVERGLLDLDAPANRYLGTTPLRAYRGQAEAITLRCLLNHTGGLPTHWNFFYGDDTPPPRPASIREFGFAVWAPGTRTNYSNFGFGVLDHLVAVAAGTTYRAWLTKELLDPLGMHRSDVGVRLGREADAAVGYRRTADGWAAVADYGFDHDGASAVRSSANDLMRFARLQIEQGEVDGARLLTAESIRAMREPRSRGAGSSYGIGWDTGRTRGTPVLRHSGGMPGVSTMLQVFPERRAAFAVLTNAADRGATNRTLGRVLDVLLGAAPAAAADTAPKAEATPAAPPAAGSYRGEIVHASGPIALRLEVAADGSTTAGLGDGAPAPAARSEWRDGVWHVACRGALPLRPAVGRAPTLALQLEPDGDGFAGVLLATVDGQCCLPFWVTLAPAQGK